MPVSVYIDPCVSQKYKKSYQGENILVHEGFYRFLSPSYRISCINYNLVVRNLKGLSYVLMDKCNCLR